MGVLAKGHPLTNPFKNNGTIPAIYDILNKYSAYCVRSEDIMQMHTLQRTMKIQNGDFHKTR